MKISLQDLYTMEEKIHYNTGIDPEDDYTLDEFLSDYLDKMDTRAQYFSLDILELLLKYRLEVYEEILEGFFVNLILYTNLKDVPGYIVSGLYKSIEKLKHFYRCNDIEDIDDGIFYNEEIIDECYNKSIYNIKISNHLNPDKEITYKLPNWFNMKYIIEENTNIILDNHKPDGYNIINI